MCSTKVHNIVECVKQYPFCFDVFDVADNVIDILDYYNIYADLSDPEFSMLKEELMPMAEKNQTAEIVHQVSREVEV